MAEGHDSKKGQTFYRPLGGTIEFGEHGDETVRREFREEISADLTEVRYLGLLENIFTYEGGAVMRSSWSTMATCPTFACTKKRYSRGMSWGDPFKAVWKRLDEFGPGKPPVYPDGLLELLGR